MAVSVRENVNKKQVDEANKGESWNDRTNGGFGILAGALIPLVPVHSSFSARERWGGKWGC